MAGWLVAFGLLALVPSFAVADDVVPPDNIAPSDNVAPLGNVARPDDQASPEKGASAAAAPPRLVVLLVIDQLPLDQLDRFYPLFGPDGFRRLMENGADYRHCHHQHFPTFTAPGHSVMVSGSYPNRTGLIANWWYSRDTGTSVGSVADQRYPVLGGALHDETAVSGVGVSPLRMSATSVGDVLRDATGLRAKVISISLKDRAAVLMGGRRPNGVYWFDAITCRFVTSRYYGERLADWAVRFNETEPCEKLIGKEWRKVRPEIDYARFADADDVPYEGDAPPLGRVFPHRIIAADAPGHDGAGAGNERFAPIRITPFGNEILLSFVRAAVAAEQLGSDAVPDLLAVSLSSNDLVGHVFGPSSQEVLDMTVRTDRQIAALMDFFDRQVGEGRWVMAVTSDHGVAPVPAYLEKIGLLPRRGDDYRFDNAAARQSVERRLEERFLGGAPPPKFQGFIAAWDDTTHPFVYLDLQALGGLTNPLSVEQLLAAAAEEIAAREGVARVYRRDQIPSLATSRDRVDKMVYRGWHAERGGDLVIVLKPNWLAVPAQYTSSHGSPYAYDTAVPLVLFGAGIEPGRYHRPVAVADIAPTLARLLRVSASLESQGRVLFEALR